MPYHNTTNPKLQVLIALGMQALISIVLTILSGGVHEKNVLKIRLLLATIDTQIITGSRSAIIRQSAVDSLNLFI